MQLLLDINDIAPQYREGIKLCKEKTEFHKLTPEAQQAVCVVGRAMLAWNNMLIFKPKPIPAVRDHKTGRYVSASG